jgi:endonuclease/exonuclease/phosphatase (EEP) superfamily protein YafD
MTLFYFVASFFIVCSYIHLIKHDAWWIRDFDFIHSQLAFTITVLIIVGLFSLSISLSDILILALLGITLGYHVYLILPFTWFHKKQVLTSTSSESDNSVRVMVSNVYQKNQEYDKLIKLIIQKQPDLLLVVETNELWAHALKKIESEFTYSIKCPLENTYGMILYSRLKIRSSKICFLVEPGVPSFEVKVVLRSGVTIEIFTAHPKPPSPTENDRSTERDAELLLIAKKVRQSNYPALVFGDFNDVAWSHTTRLFKRMSGLLDPRIGRGFFNTFHAKIPLMRFPLDHVFSSHHFTVVKMERLSFCNSDHFPIFIELNYQPLPTSKANQEFASAEDYQESQEKIREAKN